MVVIEGDAGIGKTTLVTRIVAEAIDSGMVVLAGAGDSTDQTTAYRAWRRIFLDLLEQSDLTLRAAAARSSLPSEAVEPVQGRYGKTTIRLGAFASLAPLLDDMFGRDVVENGDTVLLRGQARADAADSPAPRPASRSGEEHPDYRGHGRHSLAGPDLAEVSSPISERLGHPSCCWAPTRGPDANPATRKRLEEMEDVQWVLAGPMDAEDTGRLVARTLGAREVDVDLATMFRDRTGGNPLFVEELSRMALRQSASLH